VTMNDRAAAQRRSGPGLAVCAASVVPPLRATLPTYFLPARRSSPFSSSAFQFVNFHSWCVDAGMDRQLS
jgi:hypothetical protein